ncbi:kinesin-like protein KIF20A isoform X3 [Syngnathus scovelli]|uniref:kinesin-like protein KIF20A isoform X3 n=1 Tax=Syngnathus scovelli TaxID=161590 RepID=UPI00210F5D4C|nr:kinesin-like protein KIF20A isoform X3 [Syngnathus scovelli]
MESCFAGGKLERVGPVEVDDIKQDLLDEFSALPKQQVVCVVPQDEAKSRSENLLVYLRVRPLTGAESGRSQDCVVIEGPHTVVLKAPRCGQSNRQADKVPPQTAQRFTFTQVFGPDASQRKVFEGSVRGLVRDVLHGENCLLFTYGVTNAGKTFTFLGPEHDGGLLPRCLWLLFNSVEGHLHAGCHLKPHRCRDFSRLSPKQQKAESTAKLSLLRTVRENDKSTSSGRSTFLEASSLSSDCSVASVSESDRLPLDVPPRLHFSVWVSFCEIYKDNIHDLLEQVPGGQVKRTTLRLSQDVKGNPFIKDLKWVQVSSSEEALKVVKIGKRNQSLASTRLNQQSSRSHSIFSIRILRVDAAAVPRFLGVSELVLCDLAGSERCSRTRNTGERLKEAGNINSSLLALGKCISAMRIKQNAKFPHHVPFRESKLTHFLQFFFCGAGKVSMVVNINQESSCVDETLNVLKFSALAQKVVVLNPRPAGPDDASLRSAMEVSVLINEADWRRNALERGRPHSAIVWETTLEDVMEDNAEEESDVGAGEDDDGEETTQEEGDEGRPDGEATFGLAEEARIREEVCAEFMEIFKQMEKDFSERLKNEREILEERADRRLEILKSFLRRSTQEEEEGQARRAWLLEGYHSLISPQVLLANREGVNREDGREDQEDDNTGKTAKEGECSKSASVRRSRRLTRGNQMFVDQISELQVQVTSLERDLQQERERAAAAEDQLTTAGTRLRRLKGRRDAEVEEGKGQSDFHANMARLREECLSAMETCAQQSKVIREVTQEKMRCDKKCLQLTEELANQKAEYEHRLQELMAELERRRTMEEEGERRQEPKCVEVPVRRCQEKLAQKENKKPKESPAPRRLPLVEELKEEIQNVRVVRKRTNCQVEGLALSDNKRVNVRTVVRVFQQEVPFSSSQSSPCPPSAPPSPSIPSGAAQSLCGRPVAMATQAKRGRRKLYSKEAALMLTVSQDSAPLLEEPKEKESDHVIIMRRLRSRK